MNYIEELRESVEALNDLLGEEDLFEATPKKKIKKSKKKKSSKQNPFKNKAVLGPTDTPKHAVGGVPADTRTVYRQKQWKCACTNYKCKCIGIGKENKGEKKIVKIDKQYKKKYNKAYRDWRSDYEDNAED